MDWKYQICDSSVNAKSKWKFSMNLANLSSYKIWIHILIFAIFHVSASSQIKCNIWFDRFGNLKLFEVSKRWNKHLHRTQCREYANCTQTGIAHKKLHRRFCLLICVFAFIHVFAHLILLLLFNRSSNVKRRWMCSTFIESCYKCNFPLEGWQFKYLHRNWHCIARNSFFSRLRFTFNLIYAYRLIR